MTDWRDPDPRFPIPMSQSDRCCGDWQDAIWEPSMPDEIRDELSRHPYSWERHPTVARFRLAQIIVVVGAFFGGLPLVWWLSSVLPTFWAIIIPLALFGSAFVIIRGLGDSKANRLSRDWHALRGQFTAYVVPLELIPEEHRQDLRLTASQVYTARGAAALWTLATTLVEIPVYAHELQRLSGLIDHADPGRVATNLLHDHRQRCEHAIEALRKDAGNALADIAAESLVR